MLRIDAKLVHVEIAGRTHRLPMRGKLFEVRGIEKRPIAVGDRVLVDIEGEDGVICEVLPRRSRLVRESAGEGGQEQVLAANVTLVLAVAAIAEPTFQPELVDRILAGAMREGIDAAVVLTKVDRDRKQIAAHWEAVYQRIGYRCFATSVAEGSRTEATLLELRHLMARNETVLCGLSGAGKSSLVNAVQPGLVQQKVGELTRAQFGKHTTTHTQLLPLPGGGHVLDTPGIRNFGLYDLTDAEVPHLFREIGGLAESCPFRDCSHLVEPDCAVRRAVDEGRIAPSRFASFKVIRDEIHG